MKKFALVPLDKITTPPETAGTFTNLVGRFWEIIDNNVLFYDGMSPQCNTDESIVKRIAKKGNTEIKFIPVAYIPIKFYREGWEYDITSITSKWLNLDSEPKR